jgi:hypothetical protein
MKNPSPTKLSPKKLKMLEQIRQTKDGPTEKFSILNQARKSTPLVKVKSIKTNVHYKLNKNILNNYWDMSRNSHSTVKDKYNKTDHFQKP